MDTHTTQDVITRHTRGRENSLHLVSDLHRSPRIQKPLWNGGYVTTMFSHWNQEWRMGNGEPEALWGKVEWILHKDYPKYIPVACTVN